MTFSPVASQNQNFHSHKMSHFVFSFEYPAGSKGNNPRNSEFHPWMWMTWRVIQISWSLNVTCQNCHWILSFKYFLLFQLEIFSCNFLLEIFLNGEAASKVRVATMKDKEIQDTKNLLKPVPVPRTIQHLAHLLRNSKQSGPAAPSWLSGKPGIPHWTSAQARWFAVADRAGPNDQPNSWAVTGYLSLTLWSYWLMQGIRHKWTG